MANELRHNTVGAQLSQAEFEDVALHIFNSQATGDILYASSATQLTRLGIGGANSVLVVSGGIPSWSATLAGLTLTAPAINGTVTTTGLTLPAHALNGNLTLAATQGINLAVNNSYIEIEAGADTNNARIEMTGKNFATPGYIRMFTPNTALTYAQRFNISGGVDTAVATWSNVNHDFGSGTITTGGSACVASFGPSGVTSITIKNGLVTAIS